MKRANSLDASLGSNLVNAELPQSDGAEGGGGRARGQGRDAAREAGYSRRARQGGVRPGVARIFPLSCPESQQS